MREKADRIRPAANFFNRPVPLGSRVRGITAATAATTTPASKIIQRSERGHGVEQSGDEQQNDEQHDKNGQMRSK